MSRVGRQHGERDPRIRTTRRRRRGVFRFAASFFDAPSPSQSPFVAVLAEPAASRTARFRSPRSAYSSTSAACAARGSRGTTSRNPTTFTCETRSSRNRRSASSPRSNGVDRRSAVHTRRPRFARSASRSPSRAGNDRVWSSPTRARRTTGRSRRSTSRHRNVEAVEPAPNAESTRYGRASSDPSSPGLRPAASARPLAVA